VIPDEDDEKQFLAEQVNTGLYSFSAGIQMQIALIPSDDVQLVAGSHARWDTPEEYNVRCADGRTRSTHEMPSSLRVALQPGDAVLFNAWGFHRGRYHIDKPRRTLMFTYTPSTMPTYDYFSDQPWFLQPGHLDHLNAGTRAFFQRFKEAFEPQWRARGADENSVQIPSVGSQARTAEDYAYVPALQQSAVFMEQIGVEVGVLARL
jgi:hypothetical protein